MNFLAPTLVCVLALATVPGCRRGETPAKPQQDALVVPVSAVLEGQNGAYVYVVTPASTVSNRNVRVDRTVGDEAIIAGGVAAGESVVTDGQLRLAPGMRVTIKTEGPAGGAGASRHP
jgi:multidrug efflux system membrane fusion protein